MKGTAMPAMSPPKVADLVIKRFGRLIIPVTPPVKPGDITHKYGNSMVGMRFKFTQQVTIAEWKEHAKFLRSIGVGVPRAVKPEDWEFWEMMPDGDTSQS